ncbi:interleukin-25-like [Glandiceps talaboti]
MYPYSNTFGILPFDDTQVLNGQRTDVLSPSNLAIRDSRHAAPEELSTCPFSYSFQTDNNRIPRTLEYVTCSCEYCIKENGSYHHMHTCQPIKHRIPVFKKKGCMDGLHKYELEYEEVPVACACLRSRQGRRHRG